ncbi:hypothetical protein [uncultured Dubosiella sp.]|uniref:hypothetical protein n=1 Tax=uncultured Dubosiella sp. TaxID=1937011 RepID=UPI002670455D|nr:hypothetical protein [uncultured Dubosiella sp.]
MSNKDITQKALLRVPDVFASLVNLLLFHNAPIISSNQIRYLDIPSHFVFDDSLHDLYRDVCALILDKQGNPLFIVCFENQIWRDWTMPIRALGYGDTLYFWQRSQILHKSKAPFEIPLSRFIPCVTFVLHYGDDAWNAKSLDDLTRLEKTPFLKPFVSGYTMNLENIAWWSEEKIASIRSDFRIIADYCAQIRRSRKKDPDHPMYEPPKQWKIEHVEETLMTLAAFSNDRKLSEALHVYLEQFDLYEQKKGGITMRSVIDYIEEKAYLKFEKKDKEYNRQLKEKDRQLEEKDQRLEEKDQRLEEKDQRLEEKDQQLGQMTSTLVVLAQQKMVSEELTAEQACDALGYSDDIRKLVLPYLVS